MQRNAILLCFFVVSSKFAGANPGGGGGGRGGGSGRAITADATEAKSTQAPPAVRPASYRGAGGGHISPTPTITGSRISTGLFPGRRAISAGSFFVPAAMYKHVPKIGSGIYETDLQVIVEPRMPFMVDNMTYFWESAYIPEERDFDLGNDTWTFHTDGTKCVHLSALNTTAYASLAANRAEMEPGYLPEVPDAIVELCNLSTHHQCARPVEDLNNSQFSHLLYPNGGIPSNLFWLCPKEKACCEWECCDLDTDYRIWIVLALFLLIFVSCAGVAIADEVYYACYRDKYAGH